MLPPGSYDRTLPAGIPDAPDILFYRGNFCGIRLPGVALLPGMAGFTEPGWRENAVGGKNPPWMAVDVPRLWLRDPADAAAYLTAYVARGYTHMQCTVGHAVEIGMTIEQYVAYCGVVQSYGLWVDQWFLGFGLNARDKGADYWRPMLDPWIDALLANGVIDCACVGWQLDQFNTGTPRLIDGRMQSPIQSIIDYVADKVGPHDIPLGTHWVNEAGAWNDPFDRFQWWKDQRNKLTWFHHQGDVDISVPEYQAKLVDTLDPFGNGRMGRSGLFGDRPFGLVIYECSAQKQFNLQCSEEEGDQRGYLLCCTRAAAIVSGYGNGARRADGSVL